MSFCATLPVIGRRNHWRISRIVTLPDYQGVGIGMRVAEAVCDVHRGQGHRINVTASHPALIAHCRKSPRWRTARVLKNGSGNTARFIQGYPVVLAIVARDDSPGENHNQYLAWREIVLRQFHHKRFSVDAPAVTFYDCVAEPGPIVDWTRWTADNQFVTVFTLRFFTRLVRGEIN